ncbi:MAG: dihydrodipicolinate synthase family protein [Clostridia bacterium]|nr:dihydrodipicolinate synthase family protein [Clostridia bacterium]
MKFKGIIPALVTPVNKDRTINVPALEKLVKDLIEQGADGFYVGGATGEGVVLSADAHRQLTREVIRITDRRVPVIVHVARMNNEEMIELAKYAESCGADAISAIPPIFYKYGNDGIYEYYKELADSVNIPIIIYNNPNTGVTFTQALLDRLFTIKQITGIKWTNYDFSAVMQLKYRHPEINIINGPDEVLLLGLTAGCDSCIGTTYNFVLPLAKKIYNAFLDGDMKTAQSEQMRLACIVDALLWHQGLMASRVILKNQGYDGFEVPHFPMVPFTKEQETELIERLKELGMEF